MDIKEKKGIQTEIKDLHVLHSLCFRKNIPFVSYRPPENSCIKTLLQTGSYPEKLSSLKNIYNTRGFIISPFQNKAGNTSFILEPDIEIENDHFDSVILSALEKNKNFSNVGYLNGKELIPVTKKTFTGQVSALQNEIKKGVIKKAVLSRIHIEPKAENFDVSQLFLDLTKKYPSAFVYLFQIPDAGCWIGATPEPLLLVKNNLVETISLAGTQKAGKTSPEKVKWPVKEIEEQDIVTKYIEDILINFDIKEFTKTGPFTYVAGNVMHLKTRFQFSAKMLGDRIGEFAETLHPTPSICGLPKDEAFRIIEKTEIHHREYYTGLLGPVNMDSETSLYVNLRCMKILEDKLALFLGAGITSGSVPENEWEETNQKKMTLLSAIELLNK